MCLFYTRAYSDRYVQHIWTVTEWVQQRLEVAWKKDLERRLWWLEIWLKDRLVDVDRGLKQWLEDCMRAHSQHMPAMLGNDSDHGHLMQISLNSGPRESWRLKTEGNYLDGKCVEKMWFGQVLHSQNSSSLYNYLATSKVPLHPSPFPPVIKSSFRCGPLYNILDRLDKTTATGRYLSALSHHNTRKSISMPWPDGAGSFWTLVTLV